MKKQILVVHGGMTFENDKKYLDWLNNLEITLDERKSWKKSFYEELKDNFEIISPKFPLKENAKYSEWKIMFEKYLGVMGEDIILIGGSLGGIFLARYLSENNVNKNVISAYLICPPFDDSLSDEDLCNGFELQDDLSLIMENCKKVKFMFSKDDDVVPIEHADKYRKKLPDAEFHIYESKNGHFKIEEFPELVKMIKED